MLNPELLESKKKRGYPLNQEELAADQQIQEHRRVLSFKDEYKKFMENMYYIESETIKHNTRSLFRKYNHSAYRRDPELSIMAEPKSHLASDLMKLVDKNIIQINKQSIDKVISHRHGLPTRKPSPKKKKNSDFETSEYVDSQTLNLFDPQKLGIDPGQPIQQWIKSKNRLYNPTEESVQGNSTFGGDQERIDNTANSLHEQQRMLARIYYSPQAESQPGTEFRVSCEPKGSNVHFQHLRQAPPALPPGLQTGQPQPVQLILSYQNEQYSKIAGDMDLNSSQFKGQSINEQQLAEDQQHNSLKMESNLKMQSPLAREGDPAPDILVSEQLPEPEEKRAATELEDRQAPDKTSNELTKQTRLAGISKETNLMMKNSQGLSKLSKASVPDVPMKLANSVSVHKKTENSLMQSSMREQSQKKKSSDVTRDKVNSSQMNYQHPTTAQGKKKRGGQQRYANDLNLNDEYDLLSNNTLERQEAKNLTGESSPPRQPEIKAHVHEPVDLLAVTKTEEADEKKAWPSMAGRLRQSTKSNGEGGHRRHTRGHSSKSPSRSISRENKYVLDFVGDDPPPPKPAGQGSNQIRSRGSRFNRTHIPSAVVKKPNGQDPSSNLGQASIVVKHSRVSDELFQFRLDFESVKHTHGPAPSGKQGTEMTRSGKGIPSPSIKGGSRASRHFQALPLSQVRIKSSANFTNNQDHYEIMFQRVKSRHEKRKNQLPTSFLFQKRQLYSQHQKVSRPTTQVGMSNFPTSAPASKVNPLKDVLRSSLSPEVFEEPRDVQVRQHHSPLTMSKQKKKKKGRYMAQQQSQASTYNAARSGMPVPGPGTLQGQSYKVYNSSGLRRNSDHETLYAQHVSQKRINPSQKTQNESSSTKIKMRGDSQTDQAAYSNPKTAVNVSSVDEEKKEILPEAGRKQTFSTINPNTQKTGLIFKKGNNGTIQSEGKDDALSSGSHHFSQGFQRPSTTPATIHDTKAELPKGKSQPQVRPSQIQNRPRRIKPRICDQLLSEKRAQQALHSTKDTLPNSVLVQAAHKFSQLNPHLETEEMARMNAQNVKKSRQLRTKQGFSMWVPGIQSLYVTKGYGNHTLQNSAQKGGNQQICHQRPLNLRNMNMKKKMLKDMQQQEHSRIIAQRFNDSNLQQADPHFLDKSFYSQQAYIHNLLIQQNQQGYNLVETAAGLSPTSTKQDTIGSPINNWTANSNIVGGDIALTPNANPPLNILQLREQIENRQRSQAIQGITKMVRGGDTGRDLRGIAQKEASAMSEATSKTQGDIDSRVPSRTAHAGGLNVTRPSEQIDQDLLIGRNDSPIKVEGGREHSTHYQQFYPPPQIESDLLAGKSVNNPLTTSTILPRANRSSAQKNQVMHQISQFEETVALPRKTDHDQVYQSEHDYTKNTQETFGEKDRSEIRSGISVSILKGPHTSTLPAEGRDSKFQASSNQA